MKKLLMFVFCILFSSNCRGAEADTWQPSPGHTQIAIWPNEVPDTENPPGPEYVKLYNGKEDLIAGKPVIEVGNVSRPTMTVYSPEENNNTGAAVVVFPGGGYHNLAIDLEGTTDTTDKKYKGPFPADGSADIFNYHDSKSPRHRGERPASGRIKLYTEEY